LGKVVTELVVAQTVVVKTDYLSGFQYVNDVMQFFPHAEGYVKVTGTSYDYVYNYTDHLGNIRLSYSKEPATNALKVIEENHYYPFGLKHTGYNSDQYYIAPSPVLIRPNKGDYVDTIIRPFNPADFNGSTNYDYKFLGQERQDELGLNWDTFRYRNYDAAIGRFFGVDPITEEYMSISPYQFAHNNPVWKIELEGLEGVATSGQDVVNKEPVYMSTNVVINTMNIQSSKPQNSRPGVPLLRMGIGVEGSRSSSTEGEFAQANGTATAYKANIGLAVCVDGENIEYGVTIGQVSGETSVGGQNVVDGQFTTFNAVGSYNMRNGDQQFNMQAFTGGVNLGNNVNGEVNTENDLITGVKALGAYIEINLTEMGNNLQDTGNLVMSYLQSVTNNYFNQNNTSSQIINPVR
jgi:RHS repeat-associated protein